MVFTSCHFQLHFQYTILTIISFVRRYFDLNKMHAGAHLGTYRVLDVQMVWIRARACSYVEFRFNVAVHYLCRTWPRMPRLCVLIPSWPNRLEWCFNVCTALLKLKQRRNKNVPYTICAGTEYHWCAPENSVPIFIFNPILQNVS